MEGGGRPSNQGLGFAGEDQRRRSAEERRAGWRGGRSNGGDRPAEASWRSYRRRQPAPRSAAGSAGAGRLAGEEKGWPDRFGCWFGRLEEVRVRRRP